MMLINKIIPDRADRLPFASPTGTQTLISILGSYRQGSIKFLVFFTGGGSLT